MSIRSIITSKQPFAIAARRARADDPRSTAHRSAVAWILMVGRYHRSLPPRSDRSTFLACAAYPPAFWPSDCSSASSRRYVVTTSRRVGRGASTVRLEPRLGLEQPLARIGECQLELLGLDTRDEVFGARVELRTLYVVVRFREVGQVLLFLDPVLAPKAVDLGVRLAEFGALLVQRALEHRRVELRDQIALADGSMPSSSMSA